MKYPLAAGTRFQFSRSCRGWHLIMVTAVILFVFPGMSFGGGSGGIEGAGNFTVIPGVWKQAPEVVREYKRNDGLLLVDIRPVKEFNRASIPGSVNIPLHFIGHKPFLKNKTVIVAGRGYEIASVQRVCLGLREKGFHIFGLYGGLQTWKAAGGEVQGASSLPFLTYISLQEIQREQVKAQWLLVDVSSGSEKDALPQGVIRVEWKKDPRQFKADLFVLRKQGPFGGFVFAGHGPGVYGQIANILKNTGIPCVFLKGGWQEYEAYTESAPKMGKSRNERMVSTSTCGTCGL